MENGTTTEQKNAERAAARARTRKQYKLQPDKHRKLRELSFWRDRSMSQILEDLIDDAHAQDTAAKRNRVLVMAGSDICCCLACDPKSGEIGLPCSRMR